MTCSQNFKIGQTEYFKISFDNATAKQILLDTKIIKLHNGSILKNGNAFDSFKTIESLKCFVAGTFIGCGTSGIKLAENGRKATGY